MYINEIIEQYKLKKEIVDDGLIRAIGELNKGVKLIVEKHKNMPDNKIVVYTESPSYTSNKYIIDDKKNIGIYIGEEK